MTDPSQSPVMSTIDFDSVTAGTGTFTTGVGTVSGGTVFVPRRATRLALLGRPGLQRDFDRRRGQFQPASELGQFLLRPRVRVRAGTATAYSVTGSALGSVSSKAATTEGDNANFVTLSFSQPIARVTFVGGVVNL